MKSLPKPTCDLETSVCGELLPSPSSDVKSGLDVEDNVSFEVAAWPWEGDEKVGVGESSLITLSLGADASVSLDDLDASWLVSGLCTEMLTELLWVLLMPSTSPLYFQESSI